MNKYFMVSDIHNILVRTIDSFFPPIYIINEFTFSPSILEWENISSLCI